MKNIIVVLISGVIITVFIAFNYLLWDREQFINITENKDAVIDTLGLQINNYKKSNSELTSLLKEQDNKNKELENKNLNLINDITIQKNSIEEKDELIYQLKNLVDISILRAEIDKLINNINTKNYLDAYKSFSEEFLFENRSLTANEFVEVFNDKVKKLEIDSAEIYLDEENIYSNYLAVKVVIEASLIGDKENEFFIQGKNEKLFHMIYNSQKKIWIISNISTFQQP